MSLAKMLGWSNVPLWPLKGYTVNMYLPEDKMPTYGIHLDGEQGMFAMPMNGYLRVTKFIEITRPGDFNMPDSRIQATVDQFHKCFWSNTLDKPRDAWVNHRCFAPDDLPLLGKLAPYSNVYLNTG
jgi:glycine/D-amino acid oxidase-like deaminating enzyme